MRLTPDRAKQAILHPEEHVRLAAVYYFSRSFSQDTEIVPLAIKAIEQYGQDAFEFYSFFETLVHSDETVLWIMNRLASLEKPSEQDIGTFWSSLISAIVTADPELLKRHESVIVALDHLDPEKYQALQERIRLFDLEPNELWANLEDFCEGHKNDDRVSDEELDHANHLVEAIGRHPDQMADRVMAVLKEEIEDYQGNPMTWLEAYAVRMAGWMRLEEAVPDIIAKLHEDTDWLSSECMWSLCRIGTDSVVEAVAEDFFSAEWGFQFCATEILEDIHSDLSVQKCFELLEEEDDDLIRRELYKALLINGATDAIEPARELLLEEEERNPDWLELRSDLVTAATIMDVDFPELSDWKEDMQHDTEFRKKWYAEHVAPGLELFDEEEDEDYEEEDFEEEDSEWHPAPPGTITAPERVGRNDPCPCGSGKKYKKCCLRKRNGAPLK